MPAGQNNDDVCNSAIYINNKDESAREGLVTHLDVLYNIDNTHIIYIVTRRRNKPIKCRYDVIIPS